MSLTVWWIRRDLRLHDNQALATALDLGAPIIPLYIIDPFFARSPHVGDRRRAFLFAGLHAISAALTQLGSHLIIRHGEPANVLSDLVANAGVTQFVAEADVSPYAQERDRAIQKHLPLRLTAGLSILETASVLKDNGTPYTVYTAYNRRWQASHALSPNDIVPAPTTISSPEIASQEIPTVDRKVTLGIEAGEAPALQLLAEFTKGSHPPIYDYAQNRDRPDLDLTSQLSPYLRFGMISARVVALAALDAIADAPTLNARSSAQTWLDELLWREFYQTILLHFPKAHRHSFYTKYDRVRWENDEQLFAAWCEGRTGYPYIDAAMRQLAHTGWMHNRARMAVASFLVKDLLIDWRWGEQWFMQQLLDGDPAANNGGWQWSAGSGPNAAPYFRIFNPITQGTKFDPNGDYVRRWVPEVADVPTKHIHTPWKMPKSDQIRFKCTIGDSYPAPIVDHDAARRRTLDVYKAALRQ